MSYRDSAVKSDACEDCGVAMHAPLCGICEIRRLHERAVKAEARISELEAALRSVTMIKCHAPIDFLRVCQCCEDVHAVLLPVPTPQPSPSVSDAKMLEGADARAPEVEAPVETGDSTVGEAGASAGLRSSEACTHDWLVGPTAEIQRCPKCGAERVRAAGRWHNVQRPEPLQACTSAGTYTCNHTCDDCDVLHSSEHCARMQEAKPVGEGLPYAEQSGEWRAGYDEAAAVAHAEQRDLRRQLRECSDKAPTKADLDAVYEERDKCVALIAAMAKRLGWKVGLAEHSSDPSWDPAWRTIVFVDLPAGQVSWHIHDRERSWFAPLPDYDGTWDGHSTPVKYVRVLASALNHRSDTATQDDSYPCCEGARRVEALPGDATTLLGGWCPTHGATMVTEVK